MSGGGTGSASLAPLNRHSLPPTRKPLNAQSWCAYPGLAHMSNRPQRHRVVIGILISLWADSSQLAAADPVWKKLRYQGGTIEAKVNPFDWNTTLKASGTQLEFSFAGQKTVAINTADVTALSYGQKAYRRVADMAALSAVVTPVALFGILHKSKDHLIGIQYKSANGQPAGVLFTVHKDDYRELLLRLRVVTGKPVENWP